MDVVYAVKDQPANDELTYSLRSLVNLPHDKVVFVGGCPNNINKSRILHIPLQQASPVKYRNTTLNLLKVCQDPRVSDDFIWMNDDFFILKPIQDPIAELNLANKPMADMVARLGKGAKATTYLLGIRDAHALFKSAFGWENPISFELHTPMVFNKAKVIEMLSRPEVQGKGCVDIAKRSLYGNLYMSGYTLMPDVKILIRTPFTLSDLQRRKFLSTSDRGWPRVKAFVVSKFPQKSVYEL